MQNMRIQYNKLWKLMIDKNMKKSDLRDKAGISVSVGLNQPLRVGLI